MEEPHDADSDNDSSSATDAELNQVIKNGPRMIAALAEDDPARLIYTGTYADALFQKYRRGHGSDHLANAISALQQAMRQSANVSEPDPYFKFQLGCYLYTRFEETPSASDIDESISLMLSTSRSLDPEHKESSIQLDALRYLGQSFYRRYTAAKDLSRPASFADLTMAIKYASMALDIMPETHEERPVSVTQLFEIHYAAFGVRKEISLLDRALEYLRMSQEFDSDTQDMEHFRLLVNLSELLWVRYDADHSAVTARKYLDESITKGQQAIAMMPNAANSNLLHNLSVRLGLKHKLTNQVVDVDESIRLDVLAIERTSPDSPQISAYRHHLANRYVSKYHATLLGSDLEEAIFYNRKALQVIPADHARRAETLNNLALVIFYRHEREGSLRDLEEALILGQQAVLASPKGTIGRRKRLYNVIVRMLRRHSLELHANGIAVDLKADPARLDTTAENDQAMGEWVEELARALGLQEYPPSIARQVIPDSVFLAKESLSTVTPNHSTVCLRQYLLGTLLSKQAKMTNEIEDIETAVAHWRNTLLIKNPPAHFLSDVLFSLSSALLLKHTIHDDEDVSILFDACRVAMNGWVSAAEDNPRLMEYEAHLDHLPGTKIRRASSRAVKHSCPNCKALWQFLDSEDHGSEKGILKRLAYNEITGKLEAIKLSTDDVANSSGNLRRMLATSASQSIADETSQDFSKIGMVEDSVTRGVIFMDVAEIKDKASLPQQAEIYSQRGSLSDLTTAISIQRFVIERTKPTHPKSREYTAKLGFWLHARYLLSQTSSDLDEAIFFSERALAPGPTVSEDRLELLGNAVVFYETRFKQRDMMSDLNRAVELCQEGLGLALPHSEDHKRFKASLAYNVYSRFERMLAPFDLDQAIVLLADLAIAKEGTTRLVFASNLIKWYHDRWRILGDEKDISEAIKWGEDSIIIAEDYPDRLPPLISALATVYLSKHESTCKLEDLEKAIEYGRQAVATSSPNLLPFFRSSSMTNLGVMLSNRAKWTDHIGDAEDSVKFCREAFALSSEADPQYGLLLTNLSHVLGVKYQLVGNLSDLEEAIDLAQGAVKVSADKEHDRMANDRLLGIRYSLSELGVLYFCRFQALGARSDLDEAIEMGVKEVQNTEGAMYQTSLRNRQALCNLSSRFALRFYRYHEAKDLEEAFKYGRQSLEGVFALEVDPTSAVPLYARFVSDAAILLKDSEHLQYVINLLENRLEGVPISFATKRTEILSSLGNLYFARFQASPHSGVYGDLEHAISLLLVALKEVPSRNVKRVEILHCLGTMFEKRHRFLKRSGTSIEQAAKYHLEAARVNGSPLLFKIMAGRDAALLYAEQDQWVTADNALAEALNLISQVASVPIGRENQETVLKNVSGLSSLATTAAFKTGKGAEYAFVQLEAGRGVISALLINSRRDITSLKRDHPALYESYTALRVRLAGSFAPSTPGSAAYATSSSERLTDRQEDFRELSILESRIREFDGLGHFQHRLTGHQIANLALAGPLVSFNVNEWGSHALFTTTAGGSSYIPLPGLKLEDLKSHARALIGKNKLSSGLPSSRPQRNAELRTILTWLWKVAVRPVLEVLEYRSDRVGQRLPRVFWVANGLMGLMPLHAAGEFGSNSNESTSRYVVSTYVPTLESLAFARDLASRKKPSPTQPWLVVEVPQTPGLRDLQTAQEVKAIQDVALTSGVLPPRVMTNPTRAALLDALSSHSIVHFSCHGTSNPENPSQGGLHIEKGVPEPPVELKVGENGLYFEESPTVATPDLTISDLTATSHPTAQVAYLSACSTAENSAEDLVDEVIHLASSFQLAGFAHVIGSLWETDDSASSAVSSAFYKNLFSGLAPGQVWDDQAVAYALHDAVESLKENGLPNARRRRNLRNDPLAWAPFVHVGI